MKLRLPLITAVFTLFATLTVLALVFERNAFANDRPVIVEYVVAPECASNDAFERLVKTELARAPDAERTWRFSVHIHGAPGMYQGTLTTETGGVRTVTAKSCDEITAAFALIIAMADESGMQAPIEITPETSLPLPPSVLIQTPPAPPVPPAFPAPRENAKALSPDEEEDSHVQFRLSARGFVSTHGDNNTPAPGALGVVSIELPFGFRKTQFDVAIGTMSTPNNSFAPVYTIIDTQTCLVDLPIGNYQLSVLGCIRLAGATYNDTYSYQSTISRETGGAFWTGVGARLRWQAQIGFFAEVSLDGVYGTVSSGEDSNPLWFDAGASLGWRVY